MQKVAPTDEPDLAGFRYVAKKKPSRKQQQRQRTAAAAQDPRLELKNRYQSRSCQLEQSRFFSDFREALLSRLKFQGDSTCGGDRVRDPTQGSLCRQLANDASMLADLDLPRVERIKMLGIGTLSHNPSLFQCHFGLRLVELLNVPLTQVVTADPMYTALDRDFLQSDLGLKVLSADEAAEHDPTLKTLLFLPHVPKSVTEAALRVFWTRQHMSNLVILGNDIRRYPETYPHAKLERESPCLLAASRWAKVTPLTSSTFEHNNVFNDLAFHTFGQFGEALPRIAFDEHDIEKEHFETNQDDVRRCEIKASER